MLHKIADLGDVNEGISVSIGHLVVDLGDDQLGGLGAHPGIGHAAAQAHIAVLIRGRDLDEGHIQGLALPVDPGQAPVVAHREVHPALPEGLPGVLPQHEGVEAEAVLHARVQVFLMVSQAEHLSELDVAVLVLVAHHGIYQVAGIGDSVFQKDTASGLDMAYRLVCGNQALLVVRFPIHFMISPFLIDLCAGRPGGPSF